MKLPVTGYGWTDDVVDPDFFIEAPLPPTGVVRVQPGWLFTMALRAARKQLHVERRLSDNEPPCVRVVLGMTVVYRLFGRRLDEALLRLVELQVNCEGQDQAPQHPVSPP